MRVPAAVWFCFAIVVPTDCTSGRNSYCCSYFESRGWYESQKPDAKGRQGEADLGATTYLIEPQRMHSATFNPVASHIGTGGLRWHSSALGEYALIAQ